MEISPHNIVALSKVKVSNNQTAGINALRSLLSSVNNLRESVGVQPITKSFTFLLNAALFSEFDSDLYTVFLCSKYYKTSCKRDWKRRLR